jgi:predicted NAD/FAD-binding protein
LAPLSFIILPGFRVVDYPSFKAAREVAGDVRPLRSPVVNFSRRRHANSIDRLGDRLERVITRVSPEDQHALAMLSRLSPEDQQELAMELRCARAEWRRGRRLKRGADVDSDTARTWCEVAAWLCTIR